MRFDLASNLPIGIIGNADAAWFGDSFKACHNIDAVAEDIVIIENNIADMNADAELDPFIAARLFCSAIALEFTRASRCIDSAGKLDEHAVSRSLDDMAAVGGDCWVNKAFLTAFSWASVPSSLAPIRRLYPATSAARYHQSPFHALVAQDAPRPGKSKCLFSRKMADVRPGPMSEMGPKNDMQRLLRHIGY